MKIRIAVLAAAAIASIGGQALAAECLPDPSNKCTVRFPDPNDWIARLVPKAGGQVVCDGIPSGTVQYDSYGYSGGGYVYMCSISQPCSAVQSFDPQAYAKFCP